MITVIRGARVVTPEPAEAGGIRGAAMGRLRVLAEADVIIEGETIREVTPGRAAAAHPEVTIEADGRVLLPGFVDCHTHACWAGSRVDEWARGLAGEPYLEILKSGGGIMGTVRATRDEPADRLAAATLHRVMAAARCGTTTIEVKSGYGLSTEHELRMLRAIRQAACAAARAGVTVMPTALLGHAIDPVVERGAFVQGVIEETLPAVHAEFPGVTVDAYCERGAWSVEECAALFEAARRLGHPVRVHADQFTALGMTATAVRLGAVSVDHLEAATADGLHALAVSGRFGVMLPCCGFHLDGRYADGRGFVDAGGALALATNHNPGSAPCWNMGMVIALAVRRCGVRVAEAITACTANPAALLGLRDRGSIAPGMRADVVLLEEVDERALGYAFGASAARVVIAGGRVVHRTDGRVDPAADGPVS